MTRLFTSDAIATGYVRNKWIFRVALLLILIIVACDFYMNDYSIYTLRGSCDVKEGCMNPLVLCSELSSMEQQYMPCQEKYIRAFCPDNICHNKYLPDGYTYGRTDGLSQYGWQLMLSIFILAFVLNHILYIDWRKKNANRH